MERINLFLDDWGLICVLLYMSFNLGCAQGYMDAFVDLDRMFVNYDNVSEVIANEN